MTVGMAIITQDAFDGPSVPDPEGDFQQGWYYWASRANLVENAANDRMVHWDADIRTQRVLRGGYVLVFVTQNLTQELPGDITSSLRLLWEID